MLISVDTLSIEKYEVSEESVALRRILDSCKDNNIQSVSQDILSNEEIIRDAIGYT